MPVSGTWLTEWTLFQECMNSFAADIARATEERKSKQFKHVWNVICGGCWRRIKNAHSAATARLLCRKWIADERKNEERKNHGTNVADAGRNASFVFEEYRIQITRNSFQTADISYFFFCSSVLSSLANRIMIFFSSLDTLRGISDALAWLMHCCCLFSTLRSFSLDFFPTHTYPNMVHIFSCLSLLGMKWLFWLWRCGCSFCWSVSRAFNFTSIRWVVFVFVFVQFVCGFHACGHHLVHLTV